MKAKDKASIGEDGEEKTEDRELAELLSRASVGDVFANAVYDSQIDGATKELQDHLGVPRNVVPLALLRSNQEIETAVFPMSVHAFLGIPTPTVPTGDVFPVLSTSATVRTPAEGADADETTGAFLFENLTPKKLQASFYFSREDRKRFKDLGNALRMNLAEALSDKLDQQILNGTDGLFNGANLPNNAATAVSTFASYKSQFAYGRVDGQWAASVSDVRIVMGSGTYAHAATVYPPSASNDAALSVLMADTSGVMVSSHVPAVDSSKKQNAVIRLGMRTDMVAPIWEDITLIPDEVTKAKSGEVIITAVMQHSIKILRAGGFYKQESQHA